MKPASPRYILRAAWKDGWVAAWLIVAGFSTALSFGHPAGYVAGAFFGATIGLAGGYFVTQNRNYRRTSRESLERELRNLRQLEMSIIARGFPDGLIREVRGSRELVQRALEELR